jgi:choline dehydrogenase
MGLPRLADINTPGTTGIGYTQATVTRRGRRASSYQAFLKPAMRRRNLTAMTDTLVERVAFEGSKAVGVIVRTAAGSETIDVAQEVILSAGALQSPKLLQLSGIGPTEALEKAGVSVRHPLPAVGRNLADHAMFSIS